MAAIVVSWRGRVQRPRHEQR